MSDNETREPPAPGYNVENAIVPDLDWVQLGRDDEIGYIITQAHVLQKLSIVVVRVAHDQPYMMRSQLLERYALESKTLETAQREAELVVRRILLHGLRMLGALRPLDVDPLYTFAQMMLEKWADSERARADYSYTLGTHAAVEREITAARATLQLCATGELEQSRTLVE